MTPPAAPREATRLAELSPQQWKSGIAAWLGWLFDGLELHLYTLVATPLVAHLLNTVASDPAVKEKSGYIQAAFLIGWALGGAFFGRIGDILGRSRALALTVLTYALCTGLCAFSQTWWQLMLFRFVAALGIGGEWAVGASLLTETWPRAWRPWLAAVLQTGVNLGVLFAAAVVGLAMPWFDQLFTATGQPGALHALVMHAQGVLGRFSANHLVFLLGVIPALLVFWIRRHVPEPETWQRAEAEVAHHNPGARELFRGKVAPVTLRVTTVCALGLSAWWLFLFWQSQHLRNLLKAVNTPPGEATQLISGAFFALNAVSILGNFAGGWLALKLGNRRAIVAMFIGLGLSIVGAFIVPRGFGALAWFWCPLVGFFGGVFALFTMYLPPLFPTLLRTTGAGFCYNIGRIAAGVAAIMFGFFAPTDFRLPLLASSALALAAALASWWLPERTHENEAI